MSAPIRRTSRAPLAAARRGTVPSSHMEKLRAEMDLQQKAPQALAVPAEWRKPAGSIPPCEIIFDSTSIECQFAADSGLDSSCDSVAESCDIGSSSCCGGDCDDISREEVEERNPNIVERLSDAELTRQLRAIQVNPFPARVQGICQHWHALLVSTDDQDSFGTRLMQHGGMEALLDAMILQKDFPQVQQAACWVLGALVLEEAMFKEWFVECSGLQSILTAMRTFQRNGGVQEAACAALQCLTYNHEPSQVSVVRAGGVEAIFNAMKKHRCILGVQEQACAALVNLVCNSDIKIQRSILSAGGLTAVHLAMEAHPDSASLLEYGCIVVGTLAKFDHEGEHNDEAVRVILKAMKNHESNAGLLQQACRAIQRTTTFKESNKDQQAAGEALETLEGSESNLDIIRTIVEGMKRHSTNVPVSKSCLGALHSLIYRRQQMASLLDVTIHTEDRKDDISFCIQKIITRHPQLEPAGTKLIQKLKNRSRTTNTYNEEKCRKDTSNGLSGPFDSPRITTQKTSDLRMVSPTDVTSVFVNLSCVSGEQQLSSDLALRTTPLQQLARD